MNQIYLTKRQTSDFQDTEFTVIWLQSHLSVFGFWDVSQLKSNESRSFLIWTVKSRAEALVTQLGNKSLSVGMSYLIKSWVGQKQCWYSVCIKDSLYSLWRRTAPVLGFWWKPGWNYSWFPSSQLTEYHLLEILISAFCVFVVCFSQEAVVSCWVEFSDGAVTPLELFDRSIYSLTVSTPDERVATVRRTPLSTFVVAQGEGKGKAALVRVELRICEECQKSKRKSKLAVGTGLLRINFLGSGRAVEGGGTDGNTDEKGGASEVAAELQTTVASQRAMDKILSSTAQDSNSAEINPSTKLSTRQAQPHIVWIGSTTRSTRGSTYTTIPTAASRTMSTPLSIAKPIANTVGGQKRSHRNMLDDPNSPSNKDIPKAEATPKKDSPKSKPPKIIESDLIRTFRAMSDLEIGMYALVGVSCVAILAFFLNCASYNLCFRKHKTPIQTAPAPSADPKDHKHDWVWLGGNSHSAPAPGAPAQAPTLKCDASRPAEARQSVDTMGQCSAESTLPTVSVPSVPERTATLGRSRTSSQQQKFQTKAIDPMANRSATLLARPHRSEPLHSPTSKRNQVQFTTFTTLDIKHLAALKQNGVDLNWPNQQMQPHQIPAEPNTPLPDMPWPVVKPLGEFQWQDACMRTWSRANDAGVSLFDTTTVMTYSLRLV